MGIYEYSQYGGTIGAIAFGIDALVAVSFLACALWSRKQPVPAFITALVLYIVFIVAFAILGDFSNVARGIILKVLIIGALIKAVKDAKAYTRVKESFGA
jgi:hypothetical protein